MLGLSPNNQKPQRFATTGSLAFYDYSFVLFLIAELLLMLPSYKGGYPALWQTVLGFVLCVFYAGLTVYQGFVRRQMSFTWNFMLIRTYYGKRAMAVAVFYLAIIAFFAFMTFLATSPLRFRPI